MNSGPHAKATRVATLLVLSVCCPAGSAQKSELLSRVQEVFKQREPIWKIEQVIDNQLQQSITLRNGKRQAAVQVMTSNSPGQAHETFDGLVVAFDNTRGKGVAKSRLENLGDENYLWANRQTGAWSTIRFRQDTVIVSVFAPSVVIAKRFAREILEQLHSQ